MGVADACSRTDDGVRVDVEVVPGVSDPGFPSGYNPWRERVQARVSARPTDGAANAELVDRAAEALGVPADHVAVVTGHTARRKTLLVRGTELDDVVAALSSEVLATER